MKPLEDFRQWEVEVGESSRWFIDDMDRWQVEGVWLDLVYLSCSGEGILVLSVRRNVLAEGVYGLLGFFIFNSDSSLIKGSKIRVMGKDIFFLKWDSDPLIISSIYSSSGG